MSYVSTTLDPTKNSLPWCFFVLGGRPSPGTIPKSGIKGFKRSWGWDKKKGKGTKGATLTLTSAPPCEGTITLQLFRTQDFLDWDIFVTGILSITPEKQKTEGLSIYHPSFSCIGLTTVVVEDFTPPEHKGKGLYEVQIKLCEWSQPPPTSVVSTPSTTKTDSSGSKAPQQSDRNAARLKQIEAEKAALKKAQEAAGR